MHRLTQLCIPSLASHSYLLFSKLLKKIIPLEFQILNLMWLNIKIQTLDVKSISISVLIRNLHQIF